MNIINVETISKAIFTGTAKEASEKTGLSESTIRSYKANEKSKNYRNWKGMSLETAIEVSKKMEENKMKKIAEFKTAVIEQYLTEFTYNKSEANLINTVFGSSNSDVTSLARSVANGDVYILSGYDVIENLEELLEDSEDKEEIKDRIEAIDANAVYIDAYGELEEVNYVPEAYLVKYGTRGMDDEIHIKADIDNLVESLRKNGYSNDSTEIYDNDLNKVNW